MRAMVLKEVKQPLELQEIPKPKPKSDEILIKVATCALCRTDLHIADGELLHPKLPLVLGHQIVGIIEEIGKNVKRFKVGDRVGVPWLAKSCGKCSYCKEGKENLCDNALFTGYDTDGGFAEYTVANAEFCFLLPAAYSDLEAAPLLCAGLIGYRALRLISPAKKIGFYGFGSAAHILTQIVTHQGGEVYAFTKKGEFAKKWGAVWSGDSSELPPSPLDAAIIFAPVGSFFVTALNAIKKGGSVISAGIHMSDIPSFPYALLWGERKMTTVANLTRKDGEEFLSLAAKFPIKTEVVAYPLEKANEALEDHRLGRLSGTAVIVLNSAESSSIRR